jgi:nicotinate-nucleotide adenylyltransferase
VKKIGLYFGSFNPVHIGHLIIAEYFRNHYHFDEVWFVVSPQNPLKDIRILAPEEDRLKMLRLSLENATGLIACDVEFALSKPSYTCNTLRHLRTLHSDVEFTIILGEDNRTLFHQWKEFQWILTNYAIRFFPRIGVDKTKSQVSWSDYDCEVADAPLIGISSTLIRSNIELGLSSRFMVPDVVLNYIQEKGLYK